MRDLEGIMLRAIRTKTASWLTKALFLVLIGAFAAWGIGDIFRSGSRQTPILKVGSSFVYQPAAFQRDLRQRVEYINQVTHAQFTTQQYIALGGLDQLLQETLTKGLLTVYAGMLGITIPDETVAKEIRADPAFRNEQGQFDSAHYAAVLQNSHIDEASYIETRRADTRVRTVLTAYLAPVAAPRKMVDDAYHYGHDQRSAMLLKIPASAMASVPAPSDADLKTYYEAHQAAYRTPALRAAQVAVFRPADFTKDISVSESEIAQEYESRRTELTNEERRDLEQIILPDEASATALAGMIAAGKSFTDAVREKLSTKPITLNKATKNALPQEIADKVFALKSGEVSPPLKSSLGYHLVHVIAVEPAHTKSLAEVKESLRNELVLSKAGDALNSVITRVEDDLAGGISVADAAKKAGVAVTTYAGIDASGKDAKGQDVGLSPEIVGLIAQANAGDAPQIQQLSDGSSVLIGITGVTPAQAQPLDKVREKVREDWRLDQQKKAAIEEARKVAMTITNSEQLAGLAAKYRGNVVSIDAVTESEGAPEQGVSPTLAHALFAAPVGQAVSSEENDGAVIAIATKSLSAAPTAEDQKALASQLQQSLRVDLSQAFSAALGKQIPVTMHRDIAEQLTTTQ